VLIMSRQSLWDSRSALPCTPPDVLAAIENAHLVIDRLGSWPEFEDFEVISLRFDRGNLMEIFETGKWSDKRLPHITAAFYGFDIRYAPDHPDRKPTLITIRFHGVFERTSLEGFNHQNPICGLAIIFEYSDNLKKNLFAVDWGGAGHEMSFTCVRVEVMAVEEAVATKP